MARESKENIRERILAAAEKRFWHYGIKKTTIDEIAADAEVGKGTVYLHFESKEEIGLAIMTNYKRQILLAQEEIVGDKDLPILERLKRVLTLPVTRAYDHCDKSPMVMEMILAVKPQLMQSTAFIFDQEVALIRRLIDEANGSGEMHVANPAQAARILKTVSYGYMPSSPLREMIDDPIAEIGRVIDLIYKGLK